MQTRTCRHAHTHTHTHSLSLSLSHSLTHTHTDTNAQVLEWHHSLAAQGEAAEATEIASNKQNQYSHLEQRLFCATGCLQFYLHLPSPFCFLSLSPAEYWCMYSDICIVLTFIHPYVQRDMHVHIIDRYTMKLEINTRIEMSDRYVDSSIHA